MSPHLLAIRYGRSGLRALLLFNFPAAFLSVAVAAAVNPTASGDDLAILVTVPLLILAVLMRAIMIWRPQPELAPEQREAAAQALKQLTHKARWLLPLMASTVLLVWAVASLLAVPIYAAFGLESGLILYGFAWAGILFGLGVVLLIVALHFMSPAVPAALLRGVFRQFLDAVAAPLTAATSLLLSLLRQP